MAFASPRRRKNQASLPSDRRARPQARRPLVEPMEDRVVLTAASATVTQLYQDLLHRLPDSGGLAYWSGQLDRGAATQAVAGAITHGDEFHRGEVDGVYQRLLNRTADESGRAFFASALDHGQTVPQVETAVAASPEYAAHNGAGGFLDALFNGTDHLKALVGGAYQQMLHRAGDPAGLAYWAGRLSAGESLDDVTASLAGSAERAAMPTSTATVLGTFDDVSSLPLGGAGALETSLAGTAHQALGASGAAPLGVGPQAVTLKNGLPAVFQAFGPERLVDTRNPTAGPYGGPVFTAGGTRTINVAPYNLADASIPSVTIGDQAPTSNLPANVVAVSVILFIVNAPQAEYFTAYATGTSPAPTGTASVFADHAGQTIAASAIVPVNASGNINIYSSGGGNLIVDVNGYFLDALDGTDNLPISGNVSGATSGVVVGTNNGTGAFANGVTGVVSTTALTIGSAGVRGINNSTGGSSYGVYGSQAGSGSGVLGMAGNGGIGGNFSAGTGGIGVQGVIGSVPFPGGGTGVAGSAFGAGSVGGSFTGETGVRVTAGTVTGLFVGNASAYGVNASGDTAGGSFSTGANGYGVVGRILSTNPIANTAAVAGFSSGTGGTSSGVYGSQAGTGVGVLGTAAGAGIGGNFSTGTGGTGVNGTSSGAGSIGGNFSAETGVRVTAGAVNGIYVDTASQFGVYASGAYAGGSFLSGGSGNGVVGEVTSTTPNGSAAGVRGINDGTGNQGIGVYGSQNGNGVGVHGSVTGFGIGGEFSAGPNGYGVVGSVSGAGLGGLFTSGAGGIGVEGIASGSGSYGGFFFGILGASGAKQFVDPSPSDPSKQIAYVALEGNEVGTYFGGTGHFTNGVATIDVPQSFRDVTEASGLRVQVEPIGTLANTAIKSKDLSHIVLLSSADVDFDYTVNGIRKGYAGYDPVQANRIYVPHAAADTLPTWLTETQKQTLIANGTYNADGTVNLATAHNLGWDQLWATASAVGA